MLSLLYLFYLQILKKIRPNLFAKLLSEGKLVRGGPEAVMEDRDVSMVPRAKLVRVMARLVGFIQYMQYKYLMRTQFEVMALKALKHFRIKLWEHY